MKLSIIFSFLTAMLLVVSCRKEDNPKIPELTRVSTPTFAKDATGDGTISNDDPEGFLGKFSVDLLFATDVKPTKYDIVAIKNGDKSKVVTVKEGVTTFPTTIEITGTELITLFGDSIRLGDTFTIGADVTMPDGQEYPAFPLVGDAYGANVDNQPGASTTIEYVSVCPFDINDFVGNLTVDDPDFWGTSYPVTVTLESEDTYKVTGWVEEPGYSVYLKVDAATQTVTVERQVYGPTLPTTPYTNPAIEGDGAINACTKEIVLTLENTVTQGSFGTATVTLHK